VKNTHV